MIKDVFIGFDDRLIYGPLSTGEPGSMIQVPLSPHVLQVSEKPLTPSSFSMQHHFPELGVFKEGASGI